MKNAIQTLNKTAKDLQIRDAAAGNQKEQLRETLLWKFHVLHKATLLKSELQLIDKLDSKRTIAKFDEIVYGKNKQSQWIMLESTIDELYPGLPLLIRTSYPQFTETEFKVCLLAYAGLSCKEIAQHIDQSVHTVNMARTRIRQKMNLIEPSANFSLFLKQKYAESRLS
jgi:DNA-binding CsgD family transcriptional regulator